MKEEKETIELRDILGLVTVNILKAKCKEKEGVGTMLFLEVEYEGRRYTVKAIRKGVDAVLKHCKRKNGGFEVEVPVWALNGEWVSDEY